MKAFYGAWAVVVGTVIAVGAAEQFGGADDTERVAEAINAIPSGGVWEIPAGVYNVRKLAIKKDALTLRGDATFRCIETNAYFIDISGSNITLDGIRIDGGNKAAAGLVAEPNSKDWTLRNVTISNCYLDNFMAPKGGGTADGMLVKYGCERFKFYSCVFSNINHADAADRVSRGFRATNYGAKEGADQMRDFYFQNCAFDGIAPDLEGDCLLVESAASSEAPVGVMVTNCVFRNFGHRAGKFLSWGGRVERNFVEAKTAGKWRYSGFSFYGGDWVCRDNEIRGELPIGIEVGSGPRPAANCAIIANTFVCGPATAQKAIGIELKDKCDRINVMSNVVENCFVHTRIWGEVRNCNVIGSHGKNISSVGVQVDRDNKAQPSDCRIIGTFVDKPAKYGVRVNAGTNIVESNTLGNPAFEKVYIHPDVRRNIR